MERRYVSVQFNPWDRKAYTYHYDGPERLAVGDKVVVEGKDGMTDVTIVTTGVKRPEFATKPVYLP
jgi:hypothetical protein